MLQVLLLVAMLPASVHPLSDVVPQDGLATPAQQDAAETLLDVVAGLEVPSGIVIPGSPLPDAVAPRTAIRNALVPPAVGSQAAPASEWPLREPVLHAIALPVESADHRSVVTSRSPQGVAPARIASTTVAPSAAGPGDAPWVVAASAGAAALVLVAWALYSRMSSPSRALAHEHRRRIVDVLMERPGLHVHELARVIQMHPKTLQHHLAVLERVGLVHSRRLGTRRFYSVTGAPARDVERAHAELNPVRRQMLGLVQHEARSLSELARSLHVNPGTVHHHVQILQSLGLVRVEREGNRVLVSAPSATA